MTSVITNLVQITGIVVDFSSTMLSFSVHMWSKQSPVLNPKSLCLILHDFNTHISIFFYNSPAVIFEISVSTYIILLVPCRVVPAHLVRDICFRFVSLETEPEMEILCR